MKKRFSLLVFCISFLACSSRVQIKDAVDGSREAHYAKVIDFFQPLAEKGDPAAQYNFGTMHYHGEGVPQDYKEAAKWFRKSAEQGLLEAQYTLGFMYAMAQGVPQDHKEAAKWFHKAAEQGFADAQSTLGFIYFKGQGVSKNYVKAHMWLSLAAMQGVKFAAAMRDKATKGMTPQQVAEALRFAEEWKEKHEGE